MELYAKVMQEPVGTIYFFVEELMLQMLVSQISDTE